MVCKSSKTVKLNICLDNPLDYSQYSTVKASASTLINKKKGQAMSTLDQAADDAVSTLTDSPDETQTLETAEETTEEASQETDQEQPQETETATDESEWKFSDVDPKTLPKELQDVYHNLNKGFTEGMSKKSAEIKELRAQLETLQQQLSGQQQTGQSQVTDLSQLPIEDFAQHIAQQAKEQISIDQQNAHIEAAEREFQTYDEAGRLNPNSPSYDRFLESAVADVLMERRQEYENQHGTILGFDFKSETKAIIDEYDKDMSAKYKNFLSKKQKEVQQNADRTNRSLVRSSTGGSVKRGALSVDDAVSQALEKAGY